MKKTILKIVSLTLVALMFCVAFASCSAAPKGTYVSKDGISLTFDKDTVELTYGDTKKTTVEGTFEMGEEDKTIIITLPEPGALEIGYGIVRATVNGENAFNAGSDNDGDYIEIGSIKYYKE